MFGIADESDLVDLITKGVITVDKSLIISVRLPEAELRRLQLLAQVYQRSVGELIRVAVSKHVEELTRTDDFKMRALELQKRNEQTLNELLEVSSPLASDSKGPSGLLRMSSGSKGSKLSLIEPIRPDEVVRSLVNVEIVPPVGYAELGAAAKHKTPRVMLEQRRFKLTWKQGEHEWSMEGISTGDSHELRLFSKDGLQPSSITWKSSAAGPADRLGLKTGKDGQFLIEGISLAKAQKRAAVLQSVAETERNELLPIVLLPEKTS